MSITNDLADAAGIVRAHGHKALSDRLLALAERPAQQELVAIHQFRKCGCSDWYDGVPDHHDGQGPYEVRTLYTTPQAQPAQQEPVAWVHICRKRPELRVLSFKADDPQLKAKGYKAHPLTSPQAQP